VPASGCPVQSLTAAVLQVFDAQAQFDFVGAAQGERAGRRPDLVSSS
jgi:hypothetical protein